MPDMKEVPMFLKGDRVMFYHSPHKEKLATILHIAEGLDEGVLVEFDESIERGHDGVRGLKDEEIKERKVARIKGKDGHCWWCYSNQLRRTKENINTAMIKFKKGDEAIVMNKDFKPNHGFDTSEKVGILEQRDDKVKVVGLESRRSKAYYQFINIKSLELKVPKRKITKVKFKIKDIVKAKTKALYNITTKGWLGKVLDTTESTKKPIFIDDETIRVQGKDKKIFYVNHMDFTLFKKYVKRTKAKPKKTTDPLKNKPLKEVR